MTALKQHGYTLVELLVVIALIGLIAAIAAPAATATIESARFRADTQLIVTSIRQCRNLAVTRQHTVTLGSRSELMDVMGSSEPPLADDTEVRFEVPLRCFSDGTTSSGKLILLRGDRSKVIIIAWLTGATSTE